MTHRLSFWLFVKSRLVGTLLGDMADELRWLLGAGKRHKYPELWELHLEQRWLPLILQKLLASDSCGVDVGCHIGSFLSLLKRYAPNGQHVAFEASATKSKWLQNQFPDVEIFPHAVANEAGRGIFQEDYARPGYSRLRRAPSRSAEHSSSYEVQICRLDDVLLGKGRVDLIKLDIEEGELAALQGAQKLIRKWHPAIIFECGSDHDLDREKLRRDLYDFITGDLSYEIFCFADFLFGKGSMMFDEFRKCGRYPFRAFNFIALPHTSDAGDTGRNLHSVTE
jgi:FkbM family methyltransferase